MPREAIRETAIAVSVLWQHGAPPEQERRHDHWRPFDHLQHESRSRPRAFLRDVLELTNVNVGGGWLIFGLPPSEVAVHPSDKNDVHQFYLICDDIQKLVGQMLEHGVACSPPENQGWGGADPGDAPGGRVSSACTKPRHVRPEPMGARKAAQKSVGKKPAKRRAAKAKSAKSHAEAEQNGSEETASKEEEQKALTAAPLREAQRRELIEIREISCARA